MAKLNESSFANVPDGNTFTKAHYEQDKQVIIAAVNATDEEVKTNKEKQNVIEARVTTAEGDINILEARATSAESRLTDVEEEKTDKTGDHEGTWHGLLPSQTNEAIAPQVQKNTDDIESITAQLAETTQLFEYDQDSTVDELQSAINTLAQTYKVIRFPAKRTFNMTKKLTIPSGVRIDFNGTILNAPSGNNFPIIEINGSNVCIENLIIDGDETYTSTGAGVLICPSTNEENITINRVRVNGCKGIVVQPIDGVTVENVTLNNCITNYSSAYGVWCHNVKVLTINDHVSKFNWLDGIKTEKNTFDVKVFGGNSSYNGASFGQIEFGNGNGVDMYAGSNKLLLNGITCDFNNGQGIHILSSKLNDIEQTNPTFGEMRLNQIIGCNACNNTLDGLDISNVANPSPLGPLAANITIIGGNYNDNQYRGIDTNGSRYVTLIGVTTKGNQKAGIILRNSFYVDIISCINLKNSQELAGGNSGIEITNSKYIKINGGTINGADDSQLKSDDESTLTAYHGSGVYINSCLTCDDIFISNVTIKNYTSGKKVSFASFDDPTAANKIFQVHYGDVGNDTLTNLSGGIGSTLIKNGTHYYKNNNMNSNSWRETERRSEGTKAFTGNGTSKGFNIPHGLGVIPRRFTVSGRNDASCANFSLYADATNIGIAFVTAPANGASLSFNWFADA